MLGPYGAALRAPGAAAFSVTGLFARLPISMVGIGIVLLVEASTGSYGLAGALSAVFIVGASAGAPVQARLADRYGQAALLTPTSIVHAVSLTAFIVITAYDGPTWTLVATAALAGLSLPQIGAMVRARWSALPPGTIRLHTTYSLESVFDEVVFVLGPVLVTTLATAVNRYSGLALAAALTLFGGLGLAAQRGTEPPVASRTDTGQRTRDPLPLGTLAPLVLAFVFMGGLFGTVEVSTVGFAEERGNPTFAGPVLACFAFGSLVSGVVFGAITLRSDANRRYLIGMAALTVALLPLPFIGSVWLLAVVVFVAGFAIAPTLITGNTLVADGVPRSRLTEGLSWVGTALGAGVALGSTLAGAVIDARGASTAYGIALVAGALATAVAAMRLVAARPRRHHERVRA